MPQLQLPIFPAGITEINNQIAVEKREGMVYYVHGHLPVFQHGEGDVRAFRLFTSQMIVNGTVKPKDDWRQSFFPVNDKQISLSFLTDTSSSRGCGKRGNPAGCAGFPREVGREGNRLLVFLAFHGPAFSTAQRRPRFAFS